MAAHIGTTAITNISKQVVPIVYSSIVAAKSATTVPFNESGIIQLQPGKQVTIETERIDVGQLTTFATNLLITYSSS